MGHPTLHRKDEDFREHKFAKEKIDYIYIHYVSRSVVFTISFTPVTIGKTK